MWLSLNTGHHLFKVIGFMAILSDIVFGRHVYQKHVKILVVSTSSVDERLRRAVDEINVLHLRNLKYVSER